MSLSLAQLNQVAEVWALNVTSLAVQATVVAVVLLLVSMIAKRKFSAAVAHAILLIALLKFAVPPWWTPAFSLVPWNQVPYATPTDTSRLAAADTPSPFVHQPLPVFGNETNIPQSAPLEHIETRSLTEHDELLALPPAGRSPNPSTISALGLSPTKFQPVVWLMLIHLAGSMVVLAVLVSRLVRLKRIATRAQDVTRRDWQGELEDLSKTFNISQQVQLLQSSEISVPICFGVLRPTVVVPETLVDQPGLARQVLAHELAHIRRRDAVVNWLQNLLFVVWWIHPLLWIVNRQMRTLREDACDDLALTCGQIKPASYCEALLQVARNTVRCEPELAQVALPMCRHPLAGRLQRIMNDRVNRSGQTSLAAVVAVGLVGLLALPGAGSTRLNSQTALSERSTSTNSAPASEVIRIHQAPQDPNTPTSSRKRASGIVVDHEGNPVPNAQVFYQKIFGDRASEITVNTNELGEFEIEFPDDASEFDQFHLWCYSPDHAIRVVQVLGQFDATGVAAGLEIPLPPKSEKRLRIVKPDGTPFANEQVLLSNLWVPSGTFIDLEPGKMIGSIPPIQLQTTLARITDNNGEYLIDYAIGDSIGEFVIETSEFGKQTFGIPGETQDVKLLSTGTLEGTLNAENPADYTGTKVYAWTGTTLYGALAGHAEAEFDDQGTFTIPAIAAGPLNITIQWKEGMPIYPLTSVTPKKLKAGETLYLETEFEPRKIVTITGRVITEDDQSSVSGAIIGITDARGFIGKFGNVRTDDHGEFQCEVCEGDISINIHSTGNLDPERLNVLSYPLGLKFKLRADQPEPVRVDDLVFEKRPITKGRLIDRDDQPVANAIVAFVCGPVTQIFGEATTNEAGEFEIILDRPYRAVIERDGQTYTPFYVLLDESSSQGILLDHTRLIIKSKDLDNLLLVKPK